jgi:DNA gyrase subunit A
MGRSSRGVSGMKLGNDDELTGVLRVMDTEKMLILSEYGYGKRVDFSEFSSHGRGTGGQKIYTVTDKTGEIVGCVNVLDNEEIMCITSLGKSIKLKVASIRVMGRSAQGVRILSIDKPDFVIGVDRIVKEDDAGSGISEPPEELPGIDAAEPQAEPSEIEDTETEPPENGED